jgi:hypothetical protein
MEVLFHGAYQQVCGENGMIPETDLNDPGNRRHANIHPTILRAWTTSIRNDPDLGKDIRMMVPIFYDITRRKTKVWAVLGIAAKPLLISYATPPDIQGVKGPDGGIVKPSDVEVRFTSDFAQTAYFATAEVYVTRLLGRAEFRKHCDAHKTYQAIVSGLE